MPVQGDHVLREMRHVPFAILKRDQPMNICPRSMFHMPCPALKYKRPCFLAALCAIVLFSSSTLFAKPSDLTLKSPTGILTLKFALDPSGALTYSVDRGAESVLLTSRLGFEPSWVSGFTVVSSARAQHRSSWKPLYGERDSMPDNYNELTVEMAQANGHGLTIQFRAYDEGLALRYGAKEPMEILKELTDFHWPALPMRNTEPKVNIHAVRFQP